MSLQSPGILITFRSRSGAAERLALAAAVGAVQARGSIRLRRMPDDGGEAVSPHGREILERMRREYTAPSGADAEWADALVLCGSAGAEAGAWASWLDILTRLQAGGNLEGKVGAVVVLSSADAEASTDTALSWSAALLRLGLVVVPPVTVVAGGLAPDHDAGRVRAGGRRVVAVARALARGVDG